MTIDTIARGLANEALILIEQIAGEGLTGNGGGGDMFKSDNLSGLTSLAIARNNLGLGSASTSSSDAFATVVHGHTSTDITDFQEATEDRIGASLMAGTNVTISYDDTSGKTTINSTLVGGGGGDVTGASSSTNNELPLFNSTTGKLLKNSSCVPSANGLSLISAANYAAMSTLLGLGTASTHATSFFLQAASNLSDVASASTARTNLGLGALAVLSNASTVLAAGSGITLTTIGNVTTINSTGGGGGGGSPLAYRSSSLGTNLGSGIFAVNKPAGLSAGDICIVFAPSCPTGTTLITYSGVTPINTWNSSSQTFVTGGYNSTVFWRLIDSVDLAGTWTMSSTSNQALSIAYTGNGATALNAKSIVSNPASQSTLTLTGFAPSGSTRGVIALLADRDDGVGTTDTTPTSFTNRYSNYVNSAFWVSVDDWVSGYAGANVVYTGTNGTSGFSEVGWLFEAL